MDFPIPIFDCSTLTNCISSSTCFTGEFQDQRIDIMMRFMKNHVIHEDVYIIFDDMIVHDMIHENGNGI